MAHYVSDHIKKVILFVNNVLKKVTFTQQTVKKIKLEAGTRTQKLYDSVFNRWTKLKVILF